MDCTDQLQRLHQAGFSLETMERYPRHVAAMRDDCVAMLEVTPEGLKLVGVPGWRMGQVMGVLIEKTGRQVFQAKSEVVEATPERLETLRHFRSELEDLLTRRA